MPVLRRFRPGYGEHLAQKRARFAIRNGKVYQFVKANPLSTAAEIFAATGFGVSNNPYIKHAGRNKDGKTVYRVNNQKHRDQGFKP